MKNRRFLKYTVLPWILLAVLAGAAILFSCSPSAGWNSDFILSTNLIVGTTYSGETVEADSCVYYDFIASHTGIHTISLTNLGSDLGWQLFTQPSYSDPDIRTSLNAFNDTSDESGPTSSLQSGQKYYISVREYAGNDGTFDITITFP